MTGCFLNDVGIVCALGSGKEAVLLALLQGEAPGMQSTDAYSPGRDIMVGRVDSKLPEIDGHPFRRQSRNNRLLAKALKQIRPAVEAAKARYGAQRVGIVMASSTSGISDVEAAWLQEPRGAFHYGQMEIGSPSEFLAAELGLDGLAMTLSTACSSSAKALAAGARWLEAGFCDAVVIGGVDTLCRFTIAGFSALEALSPLPCLPLSKNRQGINIGEAAALFLMTREPGPIALLGAGESSDAHHFSAPDPAGTGAETAMRQALTMAGLEPAAIDYLNLHGTATPQNDAMESLAVERVLGKNVPCSSTKPLSGHTLGAAGALEAAFCWLLLSDANPQGKLAPHYYDGQYDPALPPLRLAFEGEALGRPLRMAMSNSFGFGGSNSAIVLGRV